MTETFRCIYNGEIWPASERSREHIVPFALGGTDKFVTNDVCRSANNTAGHTADAALVNNWFAKMERLRWRIQSASGNLPENNLSGTINIGGHETSAKVSKREDGTNDITFVRRVQTEWTDESLKVNITCRQDEIAGIVRGIEANALKKGKRINLGALVATATPFTINDPLLRGAIEFDYVTTVPGYIKIALGACHHVFGDKWSESENAAALRKLLVAPGEIGLRCGAFWPETIDLFSLRDALFVGEYRHVLLVSTAVSYVFLFGKYDALIGLSQSHQYQLHNILDEARIIVLNAVTRDKWEGDLEEFLTQKRNQKYPCEV